MQDYEKLGVFYLGRLFDMKAGKAEEGLLLYDSKDLTTHAVCVGMTGSGKTGLCMALLEEAAIDGIPALVIDPKGDLGNLLLTFPELRPSDFRPWIEEEAAAREGLTPDEFASRTAETWRSGLEAWGQDGARIERFRRAVDIAVYTPGSRAGLPLKVIRSFAAPAGDPAADSDALRDRVQATVSGLLALLGRDTDPLQSREHILLANLINRAWTEGRDLDIAGLIHEVQNPPFDKIGVFDLETFFPRSDRINLAMILNNLLASPGFSAWMEGEAMDIARLLHTPEGRPRISILSIAHLSDAERMFFVTLLLNEVIAWMRARPGTSGLRALLYMDEIYGFFPPISAPPSKAPMLTLLKQARAFGLGVVLATQNPVDLDYKGLSNAGTWLIGRLQTERDRDRVLDGLEGASTASGAAFERRGMEAVLSGLGKRVFLMHNVHEDAPVLFQTRWVLSYLRGPLTRAQISLLMAPRKTQPAKTGPPAVPASPPRADTAAVLSRRPGLPAGVNAYYLESPPPPGGDGAVYRPSLYGKARLHFVNARAGIDLWQTHQLLAPLEEDISLFSWHEGESHGEQELKLKRTGEPGIGYLPLPEEAGQAGFFKVRSRDLAHHLYQNQVLPLWKAPEHKAYSRVGESEGEFRVRIADAAREKRDLAVEKLRLRYSPRLASLQDRIRKAMARVNREQSQYGQQKLQTAISLGATILGGMFGRKVGSVGNLGRATTSMRGMGRSAREKQDVERAKQEVLALQEKLAELESRFRQDLNRVQSGSGESGPEIQEFLLRPRKSDILIREVGIVWSRG